MPRRPREFLTPEARRTLISAALVAAGYERYVAGRTAHTIDIKLPINGERNFRALARAIEEQLTTHETSWQKANAAILARTGEQQKHGGLRLRLIRGGAR